MCWRNPESGRYMGSRPCPPPSLFLLERNLCVLSNSS
ncbi:TPA: hypothetical protein DCE37_13440 [Candidatus Latescibacteria bacterium]|nr:hypothetical protein [Candidatus Latescibacterota bacterium]